MPRILVCIMPFVVSLLHASYQDIEQFLRRYNRPFTTIELCEHQNPYSPDIAQTYAAGTAVLVFPQHVHHALKEHTSLVLLNPPRIHYQLLHYLSECEHFDLLIVRDIPNVATYMPLFALLADHIFIEQADTKQLPEDAIRINESLWYYPSESNSLHRLKWNGAIADKKQYHIISTFNEKLLIKRDQTVEWLPGINLTTFVYMYGIYPTNRMIRKQLKKFKNIVHNDLVLSNVIVQGAHITPIDFDDTRRSARKKRTIHAMKTIFRGWRRHYNPDSAYIRYREKNSR